jgi:hypothetical protein
MEDSMLLLKVLVKYTNYIFTILFISEVILEVVKGKVKFPLSLIKYRAIDEWGVEV